MALSLKALVLLALVCVQISGGIPDRCWCLNTLKSRVPNKIIEEFSVFPQRARCNETEIILTLKQENTVTEKSQRCLNPELQQAVFLQRCWNRTNVNNTRSTVRISECFQKPE